VTLVADGVPKVLGQTPLTAGVDPTRSYELVLARPDYKTKIERIVPGSPTSIDADLGPQLARSHAHRHK